MQGKALDEEKFWLLVKINMFKNTKSAAKSDPKEDESRIEAQREVELGETGMKISLMGIQ